MHLIFAQLLTNNTSSVCQGSVLHLEVVVAAAASADCCHPPFFLVSLSSSCNAADTRRERHANVDVLLSLWGQAARRL